MTNDAQGMYMRGEVVSAAQHTLGPLTARERELIDALERSRSLLAVAEGQFKGEFQQRVRAGIAQASAILAKAQGGA